MTYYLAAAGGSLFGAMHDPFKWLVLFAALAMRGYGLGWPAVLAFLAAMFGLLLWSAESANHRAGLATWQPDRIAFRAAVWAGFYLIFMSLAVYLLRVTGLGRDNLKLRKG